MYLVEILFVSFLWLMDPAFSALGLNFTGCISKIEKFQKLFNTVDVAI